MWTLYCGTPCSEANWTATTTGTTHTTATPCTAIKTEPKEFSAGAPRQVQSTSARYFQRCCLRTGVTKLAAISWGVATKVAHYTNIIPDLRESQVLSTALLQHSLAGGYQRFHLHGSFLGNPGWFTITTNSTVWCTFLAPRTWLPLLGRGRRRGQYVAPKCWQPRTASQPARYGTRFSPPWKPEHCIKTNGKMIQLPHTSDNE